ncbi:MAG: bifunctional UDP-N-acetylmuramoyl-tripeptide:D-alanyl-D-alanine ligase/alanine racemase [Bacteroidetes bacterium]|nr:bifunctional UDP-N-acetylmuramoyl-tripeptide:D-alanyl-D-alanine ligase/alanine racemase [Bacteroidota bacterium]
MNFSDLETLGAGKILQLPRQRNVKYLVIDSRKAVVNEDAVFFAIGGPRNDGHDYLDKLYQLGIRQFVVERKIDTKNFPDANFLLASSSVKALQIISAAHRAQFNIPVIAITGSNGKTIIKEWLHQLLSPDYSVVKNPGSYNSQIGVPLSVWAMDKHHQLGVFEAGISRPGEMEVLANIIAPTIGIFTNIGTAHDEGFANLQEKIDEKLKLFLRVKTLIYCADHTGIRERIKSLALPGLSWGRSPESDIRIENTASGFLITFKQNTFELNIAPKDAASRENIFHCVATLLHLGYEPAAIQKRISELRPVSMRMELKEGINQCQVIDDTYNNDLAGLKISLDFLAGFQKKKSVILSDILQSGMKEEELAATINNMLEKRDLQKVILVGSSLYKFQHLLSTSVPTFFFQTTEEFLSGFDFSSFGNELILVKGARAFHFEKIVARLQRKVHGTVMEIDMGKLVHNLNYIKSKLNPGVKVMAMVKAFAYGSGSEEVANLLQYHKVDYLGVAYADEGLELRKKNISLPIMVMNPTEESFQAIVEQRLEPAMYSISNLRRFVSFLQNRPAAIHLEAETGLHRLGIEESELDEVISLLGANPNIVVKSVFSHLSASDESKHDDFSAEQFERFQKFYQLLTSALTIQPLRHILNSAGILRLSSYQMDMVRLGIGLYGVDPTTSGSSAGLEMAATLKTVISQIKIVKPGQTIGYGRRGIATHETKTATIAIGYADGFSRSFSNGKGRVLINGKLALVIGNVNMDMTMIDITGIEAAEGDEVIIFGAGLPIQDVANSIGTIPYEILTSTSERVKRVFVSEGI